MLLWVVYSIESIWKGYFYLWEYARQNNCKRLMWNEKNKVWNFGIWNVQFKSFSSVVNSTFI